MNRQTSNTTFKRLSRFTRNSPFFASLRTRLLLLVLFAILPALGLIVYNALNQANHATLRAVRMAANRQDDLTESTRQLLATVAQLTEVRTLDLPACHRIFTNLLALHHVYADAGVCDLQGRILAQASGNPALTNVSSAPFFDKTTNSAAFSAGEYLVNPTSRHASLTFGYPVQNPTHQLQSVVYLTVDLSWLKTMITNLSLPPNSSLTVIDRRGVTLVRHPDDSYVGEAIQLRNASANPSRTNLNARRPESGSSGTATNRPPNRLENTAVLRSRDGTWRLYGFTRLGYSPHTPGALVGIGIPLIEMLGTNMLFLGIVSVLALAAAWYGGNVMILGRVRNLVTATGRLSAGDLAARTQVDYSKGELGQLARAFDEMAASLELNDSERERAREELKRLNEDLERRVTERTLELKRSNEDLDQFASVASHDLQEPLRMVTNYLQLLQHRYADKLDDRANEFIGFATDGAARMQRLIQDLLAYSRVTTKQRSFEPVSCQKLLDQALANLKLAVEESGARITHDPLPTVNGDPVLLSQLFQNLLSNAIKFKGDKPPEIHVGALRQDGRWQLSFRDNGIGMEPRDYDRVFVIFQRLHHRDAYPGTGIGLSLCKKIVERHGGRIWVESEPGNGTSFFLTLPAAPGAAKNHERQAPGAET